jgi:DNA-binding transcriptional regulator YhcF (GntR family)
MNFILDLEQKQIIKHGYIKNVGTTEFLILMVIQAHTDIQQGSAFPSQQTIANLTGLSIPTVRRGVVSLECKGVISRERKGITGVTHYTLNSDNTNPIYKETVILDNESTAIISKKYNTAEDFLSDFKQRYFTMYGVHYISNQRADLSQIKSKLLGKFTDEQLDAILTITFRDYSKKWANREYLRPVIGGICTFIAGKALNKWEEEKKEQDRIKQAEELDLDKYFRNRDF